MHTLAPQPSKAQRTPSTAPGSRRVVAPLARDLRRVVGNEAVSRLMAGEAVTEPVVDTDGNGRLCEAELRADFIGPLQPGDTRAVPHDFVGPLQPGIARSSSFHPTITVVTPGAKISDCGGYAYKVQWGIPAGEAGSSGWIVQKVTKTFEASDSNGNPVAPVAFDDPAGYPFWEAWEFTAGQNVWVGPAVGGARHSGDTFSGSDYGPGTKGRKTVTGEVKGIVGFAPPPGMTVRNAAPAWALPYTRSEPAAFAGTLGGAAHTLTSEWNCTPSGTVAQATTVRTNP
ncbi:hypothetical protein [Amycolatopsis sp. NPDC051128]|uniref:hypothetical protein n=1 Tax=Amycolatopsis sp. NPDC051128 TaxID=3155412 RepID=UPI00342F64B7